MKYVLLFCFFFTCLYLSWAQSATGKAREVTVEELQHKIDNMFSDYVHCVQPVLIDKNNIGSIHNPYELTFLNKIPQNGVDSFVVSYFNPDSDFYKTAVETLKRLAAARSKEVFEFLYICCAFGSQRYIENNVFNGLSNQVVIRGGFKDLNTYFLDGKISEALPELKFRKEVLAACEALAPEVYFCHQPTIIELYEQEMKGLNIKKYDRKIIRVIRRHSNLRNPKNGPAIYAKLATKPFITDILQNSCYEVLTIYPSYWYLVVKMEISGKIVERYYYMKEAKIRFIGLRFGPHFYFGRWVEFNKHKLDYQCCGYSPGYIKAARKYCEEKGKQRKSNTTE